LYYFIGVNLNREEDFFTWFLELKELGIYDGMANPYTNQFEIPAGREYYTRNADTGFESKYGIDTAFATIIDEELKEQLMTNRISEWYQ
jgi:hypothetical protein